MKSRIHLSLLVMAGFTSACSEGKRPFLMAQICVQNENGLEKFVDELRHVARFEGMTFTDNSARTQAELEKAKHSATQLRTNDGAINMAVEGEGGLGMTAGNLGLPRYQMVMGFSAGMDRLASEKFANKVIEALSSHWIVERLDSSQGAKPMKECE